MKEGLYLPRTVFLKAFTRLDTQKPRNIHACREALPFSVCLPIHDERPATWPPAEATTLPGGAGWREDF